MRGASYKLAFSYGLLSLSGTMVHSFRILLVGLVEPTVSGLMAQFQQAGYCPEYQIQPDASVLLQDWDVALVEGQVALAVLQVATRPVVILAIPGSVVQAVAVMKAGAIDYLTSTENLVPTVCQALTQPTRGFFGHEHPEAALRQSTAQLKKIFESLPDLYFRLSTDGTILGYQGGLEARLYTPPEQFLGRPLNQVLPVEVAQLLEQAIAQVVQTRSLVKIEYSLLVQGALGNFEARLLPLLEDQLIVVIRDITADHHKELERTHAEAKYRSIFENAMEGMFQTTAQGGYLSANPALARMYSYTSVEQLMQAVTDLGQQLYVNPEHRADFIRLMERQSEVTGFETQARCRDGRIIWIAENVRAVRDEQGQLLYYEGTVEDITQRKQAEAALRESEERYRILAEHATDMISRHALSGPFLYASPACLKLLGYTPEELINTTPNQFFHPEDLYLIETMRSIMLSTIPSTTTITFDYRARHKSGEYIWFETTSQGVPDDSGMVQEIIAVSRNINQRKQTEVALRQSEERTRALLDAIPDIILRYRVDGTMLDFKTCHPSLNAQPAWFESLSELDLPAVVKDQLLTALQLAGVTGELQTYEYQLTQSDGLHSYEARVIHCNLDEAVCIIRDISDRVAALAQREALEVAELRMQELQKLSRLKDDFLSTVSHELRTPMTNMRMVIRMLRSSPSEAKLQTYLQILDAECDRETNLINDLLDLQRLEETTKFLTPVLIELTTWLPELLLPFQERVRANQQTLALQFASVPPITSDRPSLERILVELVNNACKYTPQGAAMQIKVHCPTETLIAIQVINQGPTIPPEDLTRIFEKFYRIPNADPWQQGGTGLGLALVKRLTAQLQGTITVQSEAEEIIFTLTLPRELGAPPPQ